MSPSIVYRNQAVAMFDEHAEAFDGGADKPKRTRISARYDRSKWSTEYERHAFNPDRGDGGSPIGKLSADPRYILPRSERLRLERLSRAAAPQPLTRYTETEIAAKPEHGLYRLVKIAPHGERGSWRITAVCAGGHCHGKVRIFDPNTWLNTTDGALGCTACEARNRSMRLRAKLEAETNKRHGLYELVSHHYGNCAHRVILGRCTGPLCEGSTRHFSFSTWQNDDEGKLGCKKCCHVTLVKSECPRGHAYDETNTIVDSQGDKRCKACAVMRRETRLPQMREYWRRNKGECANKAVRL